MIIATGRISTASRKVRQDGEVQTETGRHKDQRQQRAKGAKRNASSQFQPRIQHVPQPPKVGHDGHGKHDCALEAGRNPLCEVREQKNRQHQ